MGVFVLLIPVIIIAFITFGREVKAPCANKNVPAECKWGCIQERVVLPAVSRKCRAACCSSLQSPKQARRDAEKIQLTNCLQQLHDEANHPVQTARP